MPTKSKPWLKKKRGKALWVATFPKQAKQLRPENTLAGGIKSRSQSEAVRMEIYFRIANLFKYRNPYCECCSLIHPGIPAQPTDDVHHTKGKIGLLLFDVRWFKAVCRSCHAWIDLHRDEARALGLLCPKGEFNVTLSEPGATANQLPT